MEQFSRARGSLLVVPEFPTTESQLTADTGDPAADTEPRLAN
jgi:hypothetical protein